MEKESPSQFENTFRVLDNWHNNNVKVELINWARLERKRKVTFNQVAGTCVKGKNFHLERGEFSGFLMITLMESLENNFWIRFRHSYM